MNLSDPRTQAILFRFALILAVTDLPIVADQLARPVFDWRLLLAGLITGSVAALEKAFLPQLANTLVPGDGVPPIKLEPAKVVTLTTTLANPISVPQSQSGPLQR